MGTELDTQNEAVESVEVIVDTTLYTEEVVFRVSYWFTDRCHVFLERAGADRVLVRLSAREPGQALRGIVGEFQNELINQRVRESVAKETKAIRELIVQQAFVEAELGDEVQRAAPPVCPEG